MEKFHKSAVQYYRKLFVMTKSMETMGSHCFFKILI